ncbi:isoprenyl transferase [Saprospira grandis]|uniref:isoprenyl transferase n=1 Tax=Saprospira grandis TaxID=1008 RepID=UPI0022DE5D6D|nr:isoprenyl transferase [Saprospira grandis]WBM74756.1 isoprenyl transferase [Saprospira grandis]
MTNKTSPEAASALAQIDKSRLPKHIAIIMDGNGRWAEKQGKARVFGHQNGVEAVRSTTETAAKLGIEYLTLYAFSTENWNRPKEEVAALMALLVQTIKGELPTLQKNKIRLQAIGDLESLPQATRDELQEAIDATAHNEQMTLILALSYSAKWEIVEAVKRIAAQSKKGELELEDIDEKVVANALSTTGLPDPELLIRTSGESRISNFLLWQIAYAELYFTPVFWPDFREKELYAAIADFQSRQRRFGKTAAQILSEEE